MSRYEEPVPITSPAQLCLPIRRVPTPDRNSHKGGRSFYFFDFDDNVATLDTPIYIFERDTDREVALSTRRFAQMSRLVGQPGPYERYEVRNDDETGSFRRFRDLPAALLGNGRQPFIDDMLRAIARSDVHWKGPSWEVFYHAVFNGRPTAIITARGHHPDTVKAGIALLCEHGHLPCAPNYLAIWPVSNRAVRRELGDAETSVPVPELKRTAIVQTAIRAMELYGDNPYHRFGISDDDPRNIELSIAAMAILKRRYPQNAFFVFDTSRRPVMKIEVLAGSTASVELESASQLDLFE